MEENDVKPVRLWKVRFGGLPEEELSVVADSLDGARRKSERLIGDLGLLGDGVVLDLLVVCFAGKVYL